MAKAHFEWDDTKDLENQEKHGVSFASAQYAFADPRRVIAEDVTHSELESRYYCFGRVGEGIFDCAIYLSRQRDPHIWRGLLEKRKDNL